MECLQNTMVLAKKWRRKQPATSNEYQVSQLHNIMIAINNNNNNNDM